MVNCLLNFLKTTPLPLLPVPVGHAQRGVAFSGAGEGGAPHACATGGGRRRRHCRARWQPRQWAAVRRRRARRPAAAAQWRWRPAAARRAAARRAAARPRRRGARRRGGRAARDAVQRRVPECGGSALLGVICLGLPIYSALPPRRGLSTRASRGAGSTWCASSTIER